MHGFAAFLLAITMNFSFVSTALAASDFTLESYFKGKTYAEGSFAAINGVKRSFIVELNGRWDGKTLTLMEDFVFDDGTRDRKTWRFVKTGPKSYKGTREDVIGETNVRLSGNVARFSYLVYLDGAQKKNKVRFHDTMTREPDGTLLNTAWVTKFGLPVALTKIEFKRR